MRQVLFGCGALLLLAAASGCGGPGQGKVTGQVRFDGKPLPGGRVTFRPADARQNSVSAELDEQGNYEVVLPAGEVKVSVDNSELERPPPMVGGVVPPGISPEAAKALGPARPAKPPPVGEGGGRRAGRYVPIPERYYMVESSDLKFTVKRGEQKQDLELTK
jgi:hypothetical protein